MLRRGHNKWRWPAEAGHPHTSTPPYSQTLYYGGGTMSWRSLTLLASQ